MRSVEVCRKCWLERQGPFVEEGLILDFDLKDCKFKLQEEDNNTWVYEYCYLEKKFDIVIPLPIECPYILEHTVSATV